jgi:hypothetical protein
MGSREFFVWPCVFVLCACAGGYEKSLREIVSETCFRTDHGNLFSSLVFVARYKLLRALGIFASPTYIWTSTTKKGSVGYTPLRSASVRIIISTLPELKKRRKNRNVRGYTARQIPGVTFGMSQSYF